MLAMGRSDGAFLLTSQWLSSLAAPMSVSAQFLGFRLGRVLDQAHVFRAADDFHSTPQVQKGGSTIYIPQGRGLGGSSSVNAMA